jgi:hypothetical protein
MSLSSKLVFIKFKKPIVSTNQMELTEFIENPENNRNGVTLVRTATEVHHRRRRSKVRMEIEKYETFSTPGKDVDILLWRKVHEAVLPLLSKLVTVKRERLAASKVEYLIVIKENLEKVNKFKKFNNIEKAGGDCTLKVQFLMKMKRCKKFMIIMKKTVPVMKWKFNCNLV